MQLFNVTKTLQLGLFKLVAQLTIIIFAMWHDSYLALVIGNNKQKFKFLLQDVGKFGGKWHKRKGVNFELLYNKKLS